MLGNKARRERYFFRLFSLRCAGQVERQAFWRESWSQTRRYPGRSRNPAYRWRLAGTTPSSHASRPGTDAQTTFAAPCWCALGQCRQRWPSHTPSFPPAYERRSRQRPTSTRPPLCTAPLRRCAPLPAARSTRTRGDGWLPLGLPSSKPLGERQSGRRASFSCVWALRRSRALRVRPRLPKLLEKRASGAQRCCLVSVRHLSVRGQRWRRLGDAEVPRGSHRGCRRRARDRRWRPVERQAAAELCGRAAAAPPRHRALNGREAAMCALPPGSRAPLAASLSRLQVVRRAARPGGGARGLRAGRRVVGAAGHHCPGREGGASPPCPTPSPPPPSPRRHLLAPLRSLSPRRTCTCHTGTRTARAPMSFGRRTPRGVSMAS